MNESVIIDALRSPIGIKSGKLVGVRADDLTAQVIKEILIRNPNIDPSLIEDVILWFFSAKKRSIGKVSAMFLICYGAFRVLTEFFRTPDSHLGFVLFGSVTMGQILSAPLIIAGMILWFWSKTNDEEKI